MKRFIVKQNPPWTNDEILREYKFTNVYRILDPGTQFLFTDILNQKASNLDKLFNCFIYRIFNKQHTFRVNGFQTIEGFEVSKFQKAIQDFRAKGNTVFTSAFMVTGNIHLDTHDKVEKYCRVIKEISEDLPSIYEECKHLDMASCHSRICQIYGIGKFLSYQIMLDAMYDRILPYSENDWSFAFLRCSRGIKYIFPTLDMNDGVKCLEAMRYLHEHQQEFLPDDFKSLGAYPIGDTGYIYDGTSISLSNIENCLCEFSKYMKAKTGIGTPRNKYIAPSSRKNSDIVKQNQDLSQYFG